MKRTLILITLAGLSLLVALIAYYGAGEVGAAIVSVGWAIVLVIAARAVAVGFAGAAWRFLFPRQHLPPMLPCIGIRFVREGLNTLLPVATVGGDLVGARLITFYGISAGLAGAVMLVDLLVQAVAQFLFTMLGFGVLVVMGGDESFLRWVGFGLLVAAPALLGFFLVQRLGVFLLIERLLIRIGERWKWVALGRVFNLNHHIQTIYRDRAALARSFVLHFVVWLVGITEVWVALAFMGHPVTLAEALVIESLSQAVRGAAFPVPGALGVQEGGMIVLGSLFGLSPEVSLALALVKRVPDLVLGIPGLIAWQIVEGRQLLRTSNPTPDPGPRE